MSTPTKSAYWQGLRDGAPFILVVTPFAMLFGVSASEAGLPLAEVMSFSFLVIAGAAQFAALQMMTENAPVLVVLATALAVNLRMAMYSAALTPHLGHAPLWKRAVMAYFIVDQTYALSTLRYEREPALSLSARVAYFAGTASPVCLPWYAATWVGAEVGARIPPEFALDFALPITFLAMIAPMLRTAAHVAAALTSILLALGLAFLPYNMGLMTAALAALIVGAQVELWQTRRRARAS